jgi:hypothetical protein
VDTRLDVSVRLARESLVQWQQVYCKQQQMQVVSICSTIRWQKLAPGEVKCNVNATIFKDQECYGVGMCLKDENGTYFITMKTTWFYCLAEPQEAKARELIEAISYVRRQANNVANSLAKTSL